MQSSPLIVNALLVQSSKYFLPVCNVTTEPNEVPCFDPHFSLVRDNVFKVARSEAGYDEVLLGVRTEGGDVALALTGGLTVRSPALPSGQVQRLALTSSQLSTFVN